MNPSISQNSSDLPQRIRVSDQVFIIPTSDESKHLGFQSRVRAVSTSGLIIGPPISPGGDKLSAAGERVEVNLMGEEHQIAFTSVLRELPTKGEKLYSLTFPKSYTLSGREFVRFEVDSELTFRKFLSPCREGDKPSLGRSGRGRLLNLSLGGVLFETTRQFGVGDLLLLNLSLNFGGPLRDLLGRVQRVEKTPEGSRLVGVQFCRESDLQPQQVEQISLLAPRRLSNLGERIRTLTSELLRSRKGKPLEIEAC